MIRRGPRAPLVVPLPSGRFLVLGFLRRIASEEDRLKAGPQTKRTKSPEYEGRRAEKWRTEVQEQFEKRISFDFVDTPLADVVAFLGSITGTNMVIDPADPS